MGIGLNLRKLRSQTKYSQQDIGYANKNYSLS